MNEKCNRLLGAAGAMVLCFLMSCKEPGTAGLEVLPSNDLLHVIFSDTATVKGYTVDEDSLISTNNSSSLAGSYSDPVFGFSRAGFYAQMIPLKLAPNFGVEPQADSVLLTLSWSGAYGDTTFPSVAQKLNVYQINQDLHRDSTYYSSDSILYSTFLGGSDVNPQTGDTVITLRLDTAAFRNIILGQGGQATLGSVSSFLTYFKGIYVTPDPANTGNRIHSINLASILSRLHIYYHNATDTGSYDLAVDTKLTCVTVNHFYHDYVGAAVDPYRNNPLLDDKIYIQAMSGLKAKLELPYLTNYLQLGHIAINKAELVMRADVSTSVNIAPASQLAVQGIDSNGISIFTPDYFESLSFRGGEFDASTSTYKTNITRFVQQVLTGKTTDRGLYLVVYGGAVFANRSIVFGTGPLSPEKIKLQITYSILN